MKYLIALLMLTSCAVDVFSDKHIMFEFEQQRGEIFHKRMVCRDSMQELWLNRNHSEKTITDSERAIIKKICNEKYAVPTAPIECRNWPDE